MNKETKSFWSGVYYHFLFVSLFFHTNENISSIFSHIASPPSLIASLWGFRLPELFLISSYWLLLCFLSAILHTVPVWALEFDRDFTIFLELIMKGIDNLQQKLDESLMTNIHATLVILLDNKKQLAE